MLWREPEVLEHDTVRIPPNWLYMHYYEALSVLFRIENSLRMFVYVVLKNHKKSKWSELCIKTEDGNQSTISALAKRRLAQDKAFGYLGYSVSSPLMHLTSGELIRLILDEPYWYMFSNYFPASKDIIQNKLEEIGNVRNALVHFRPVNPDDVQVVKQNANQVLSGIENVLVNIVDCPDVVPTNSKEEWYNKLKVLSCPYANPEFNQSVDEQWVRIGISYKCPLLSEPFVTSTSRYYRILSLNTPRILRASKTILENVIFAYESIPFLTMPTEGEPPFSKVIRVLFSREAIREDFEQIKIELQNTLDRITNETDLIKEDNLARGEFVQSVIASASRMDANKPWHINTDALQTKASEDDPPEYWAGVPFFGAEFISHTTSFPWMPVTISNFSFPY